MAASDDVMERIQLITVEDSSLTQSVESSALNVSIKKVTKRTYNTRNPKSSQTSFQSALPSPVSTLLHTSVMILVAVSISKQHWLLKPSNSVRTHWREEPSAHEAAIIAGQVKLTKSVNWLVTKNLGIHSLNRHAEGGSRPRAMLQNLLCGALDTRVTACVFEDSPQKQNLTVYVSARPFQRWKITDLHRMRISSIPYLNPFMFQGAKL